MSLKNKGAIMNRTPLKEKKKVAYTIRLLSAVFLYIFLKIFLNLKNKFLYIFGSILF